MRILDLFCSAGGAARGMQDCGHHVTGVDIVPQRHYCGDAFIQADALTVSLTGYDFIWASPPCQGYSIMRNLPWLREKDYPLLILPTRERLQATGVPYCIENVMGAQYGRASLSLRGIQAHGMQAGWLCGTMFGLPFYRHRLMETNWPWLQPGHPPHTQRVGHASNKDIIFIGEPKQRSPRLNRLNRLNNGSTAGYGHQRGIALIKAAMGVEWMNGHETTQAIPPAYSRYILTQFAAHGG